jgi:erythromycin esterase
MKKIFLYFSLSIALFSQGQNKNAVDWINANALAIEDANPDSNLTLFDHNVPEGFKDARVFGFGEASHHGKEFFDLKAKFFKYLVEHQGVTVFIMEESYQSERGINRFITGQEIDAPSVLDYFGQGIWRCREVLALLQWMRDYNAGKPYEKQVRFYGMDNQFGYGINQRLRAYINKYSIVIDEDLLLTADKCASAELKAGGNKDPETHLPKLKQIQQTLKLNEALLLAADPTAYHDMLRALNYLMQYTAFIQAPQSEFRDRDMYENVLSILEKEIPGAKAFIWAHNEHINKKDLYTSGVMSVGSRLKARFNDDYYSVGFDFGKGTMKGYEFKKGQVTNAVFRKRKAPYKNKFAEKHIAAQPRIYFLDMQKAMAEPTKFFATKNRQLFLGGPGFDPDQNVFLKRKYTEAYDALIFVKAISPVTY